MKAIKKRPFAFSCILFLLFSFIFFFSNLPIKIVILVSFLIAETILVFLKIKRKLLLIYILPPIILSAVVSIFFYSINYNNILTYDGKDCDIDFVITDTNTISDTFSSYTVVVKKINGTKVNFKSLLSFDGYLDSPEYSSHSARVIFSELDNSTFGFSSRYSYLAKNIYLSARITDNYTNNQKTEKPFPAYCFRKTNSFFSSCIDRYIDGNENALIQALLLGNKDALPQKIIYNFRLLGLSHMLAVSGMHLSILVGSADKLFDKLDIGKKRKHIILIFITFIYAGITGFSASISRAATMLIIFYLSFLISKSNDSITSLCTAVAALWLISPNSMFDIGLWLSFLSTYGIVAVASPLNAKISKKAELTKPRICKILLKIGSLLIFGIIPVMFSLPAIWLSYGELALISPISNILFTPLLLAIMYTSPFVIILSFIPFLAHILGFISYVCTRLMLLLAKTFAPHAPILSLKYSFTTVIIVLLVLSYLCLALRSAKRFSLYFLPFVCASLIFTLLVGIYNNTTADDQKIIYSNTYHGDSFLVISNNKGLLCDISGMSPQNAKISEYYLNENRITDLDSYLITDYHGRGADTLDELLTYTRLGKIYLPYAETFEEKLLENKIVNQAKQNNIDYYLYDLTSDNQISFYGMTIDIKSVARQKINIPSSICITFSNPNKSFAYVGSGAYSTENGKNYLTKLFSEDIPILFGAYGKKENLPVTSLFFKENAELYFVSDNIYNLCKTTVPANATANITDKYFKFWFNR